MSFKDELKSAPFKHILEETKKRVWDAAAQNGTKMIVYIDDREIYDKVRDWFEKEGLDVYGGDDKLVIEWDMY